MTFLALSPLAAILLAAVTTAALVAMYFLKLRHRRIHIASSMLWNRILDRKEERSLWDKLRWILSVLFIVAIGLLMVFAVARPEIPALTGTAGRMTIVMDTSPSMLTRMSDGRSRWQHAVETAESLISAGGSGSAFRIADTSGEIDSPFITDLAQARQWLKDLQPMAASSRFPESDDTGSQTVFVTDAVAMPEVPKSTRKIIIYEAARNTGITAFEIRATPSAPPHYEAYLEVSNFGREARKTAISLSEAGQGHIAREAQIQPNQSYSDVFDLSGFDGGGVRATIQSDGDALSTDDVAYAYLPMKKKAKTLLVTRGNTYLEAALKLDSFVDLSLTEPANYHEDPSIDAYIFDGFAPAAQPSKPALIIGVPDVPWLPKAAGTTGKPTFSTWDEDHPVMQYLSLHDVSISSASTIDASKLTVLAKSGETPLIAASPASASGPRWIMLTFDLQASDFPVHESFPLFIDNALAWFGRERLALPRTTGMVEIPIANAQITGPDGKAVESRAIDDRTLFEAPAPGLYAASKDGLRQYIAVNLASRKYSNVNRPSAGATDARPASRFLHHEPWFYLLFLAVLLLGLEWFTYHRRITL